MQIKQSTAEWMMRYKNIDHPARAGKLKCCRLLAVNPKAHDANGLCVNVRPCTDKLGLKSI